MNVAILVPTFNHFSGFDRVAEQQALEYVKKGHKVTVIALEAKIKSNKFKIIELGMPKSPFLQRLYKLFFFLDRKSMSKYKMLKRMDLVISHFYPMNWLAYKAKKRYNIKYVYWDHGVNTTGLLDNSLQKTYMTVFKFLNNITLRNIDEASSVSKYLSKELWKQSKVRSNVVYNKIDTKKFNRKGSGSYIKKKYNIKGKKVFLYVGRISPHKGIHFLIESFKKVQQKIPNSKLIIVGKPTFENYFANLKNQANKDVLFTGYVDDKDLPSYYAASNVYVTGSQWEGFNLPAAEAQACGKPVVAFNVGSHPEVVKKGTLVRNKDLTAFANAMIKLAK